ncbi:uncharacterized protein LOC128961705 [Oppia nitens]|uniref:uncharacterized protein LOC128961705 n=1 Tax=Oppia nitens TaxID=1686743 RepID=UPI0023DB3F87|nr:uncharacterized protein LOC128961705 [Oppia nitens]
MTHKRLQSTLHLPHILDTLQTTGSLRPRMRSGICSALNREYVLCDLLPNDSYMNHIFIGFTQNGQHFLSYSKSDETNQIQLHIFLFNGDRPLLLMASHIIYTGNLYHSTDFSDARLFEGVYCYQWLSDDNYLLTIVAPHYPNSRLIDVTLIRIDSFGSYVVSPGSLTYNCNGFGRTPDFCDAKIDIEELLCPKIILSQPKVCSFITDTEIVCLEIKEETNQKTGLLDARLESNVLDVERDIFGEVFNQHYSCSDFYHYVTEYELLVYDIVRDPIQVNALLEVLFLKNGQKLLHSFAIEWCPKTMQWKTNIFSQNDEQEVHHSYYASLLKMIGSNRRNTCYTINNLSLAENHKSLTRLDSPVNAFSVILH